MIQIGKLNKRIELQAPTSVSDGMGGYTTTYATDSSAWAAIWPTSAKEQIVANAPSMIVTHRIRIRYHSTIDGSWRVKYGTRYFSIVSIVNYEEANRWLDLLCKEAAA
jgi:SPP1 family predicted phage head-tail adaptor